MKLQALARGSRLRRHLPQLTSETPMLQKKQLLRQNTTGMNSVAPGGTVNMRLYAGQSYDADVEERPEFVFKNQARYLG